MIELVPLHSVLTFHRGLTFKPDELVDVGSADSIVCFRTKNIQAELDESDLIAIPASLMKRDELEVKSGDILISTANSWELVGKCVRVIKTKYRSTLGGFISLLRPRVESIDPNYLYRFLTKESTQHTIRNLGKQTTNISNLDRVRFLEIMIPLPPLETQKQIAAILEKADQLRKDCQKMEQELNNLAQSVFMDMFGSFTLDCPLENHIEFLTSGSRGWAKHYSNTGQRFIRSLDVQMNYIGDEDIAYVQAPPGKEAERTKIQIGDVLLTITGSRIGRVAWVPEGFEDAYISQHVALIRLKGTILPEFLSYFLSLPSLGQRQIAKSQYGQTKPGLKLDHIREFLIPKLTLNQQQRFVDFMSSLQAVQIEAEKQTQEAEASFEAIMQKAFNGELSPQKKVA